MKSCEFCIQLNCSKCHRSYLEYKGKGGRSLTQLFNNGEFVLRSETTDKLLCRYSKFNYLLCCQCNHRFYAELKELMKGIFSCNILKNHR